MREGVPGVQGPDRAALLNLDKRPPGKAASGRKLVVAPSSDRPQARELQAECLEVRIRRKDRHPTIRRGRPLPCQCRSLPYFPRWRRGREGRSLHYRVPPPLPRERTTAPNGLGGARLMRLCTTRPTARRTWTVELRPGSGGPQLVCQQCGHRGAPRTAVSARTAALEHLAGHARRNALPSHLRTCQCHERGCRWHPRHRGCAGPIRLLLARERGGRLWRLADACTACASATTQAAMVPETFLRAAVTPPDGTSRRRKRRPNGPGDQIQVREMLSYLAAALPSHTGAAARLLAVQCALRMDSEGEARLPTGVLRSLRLDRNPLPWSELEQTRWLHRTPAAPGPADRAVVAQILDGALFVQRPARPDRRRAADWALRVARGVCAGADDPTLRLASLCLAAHTDSSAGHGCAEMDRIARECGLAPAAVLHLLDRLGASLAFWSVTLDSGDLRWELLPKAHQRQRQACRSDAEVNPGG